MYVLPSTLCHYYYSKIASLLHNVFILKTVMFLTTVKIYFNYQISNMFRSALTIIREYVKLHGEVTEKKLVFLGCTLEYDGSMPVVGYVKLGGASHY